MGPHTTSPGSLSGNRTACPSCGGRLRPDATFCGQCYADFRPAPPVQQPVQPAPVPLAPAPSASYGVPAPDPLTAPLLDVVLPAAAVPAQAAPPAAAQAPQLLQWPCTRCHSLNEISATACTVCSAPFMAQVSEDTKVAVVIPGVGDISRFSRGQRAAIALGAILVLLVPLALITLLLTKSPPASGPPSQPTSTSDTAVPTPGG